MGTSMEKAAATSRYLADMQAATNKTSDMKGMYWLPLLHLQFSHGASVQKSAWLKVSRFWFWQKDASIGPGNPPIAQIASLKVASYMEGKQLRREANLLVT